MTADQSNHPITERLNDSDDDSWSLVEEFGDSDDSCNFCIESRSKKLVLEAEHDQIKENKSFSLDMGVFLNEADSEGRHGTFHGRMSINGEFCYGTMVYHRGTKPIRMFQGNWRSDHTFQTGLLVYSNDNVYSGEFDKENRPHGHGRYIEKSGRYEYDGEWEHHLQHGQGCEIILNLTTDKKEAYRGEFKDGLRHGAGECTFADGTKYSGGWYHGRRCGNGTLFDSFGSILRTGKWESDKIPEEEIAASDYLKGKLETSDNRVCDADSLNVMAPMEECDPFNNVRELIHCADEDIDHFFPYVYK
ncbi:unnamed protein product [Cylindrotheca closterium]|uniref:MORN repeat-containing protein 5 n=1 Tax=Cylindrotheca closterium TaxID=2856 RepID=A0AAD2FGA8_9STRA|nr:unnamed protein product [Cylindrotheca closterium]